MRVFSFISPRSSLAALMSATSRLTRKGVLPVYIVGNCYNVLSSTQYLVIICGQGSFQVTQHSIQHQFPVFFSAESSSFAVSNVPECSHGVSSR